MPGTARIGPIETNGFDGQRTIASAVSRAAATSGLGRAASIPAKATSSTSGAWWSRTKYSWNASQPSGVRTRVRTGSSAMGRIGVETPSARWMSWSTAVSRSPARSRRVRWTWRARSLSPRRNQVGSPRRSSIPAAAHVSPARPQPRSRSASPARV